MLLTLIVHVNALYSIYNNRRTKVFYKPRQTNYSEFNLTIDKSYFPSILARHFFQENASTFLWFRPLLVIMVLRYLRQSFHSGSVHRNNLPTNN